jgi:transposase
MSPITNTNIGMGNMGYKIGIDKNQMTLFPKSLDEYVPENHICRVITAFTNQLDMSVLGFKYAEFKETGSCPYDPRMMLNLYI